MATLTTVEAMYTDALTNSVQDVRATTEIYSRFDMLPVQLDS